MAAPAQQKKSKVEEALNKQLNEEMFSSNMYRSMQAHFMHENLTGFGNWCDIQAQEENYHARRIFDFIIERGWHVRLQPVAGPPTEWASPLAAFESALEHERSLTQAFYKLYKLAEDEHDIATRIFLQWFVSEQVEEEASLDEACAKIRRVADSPAGMYMLDREFAGRSGDAPSAPGEGI
jgi:ferritin